MSAPIVQGSNFSISKVSIAAPKAIQGAAGAKMAYVSYSDSQFLLQTPCLRTPFGLNVFDKSTPPKYSVSVSLDDYKTNPKNKAFYETLVALDKFMIEQGVKNSKLWLGKEMGRELVAYSYTPCLKPGKEKDGNVYPPTFKISLGRDPKTQSFRCDFWRKSESGVEQFKDTPIEKILPRRAELTCILQCTGVWFAAGKFGLSWKAKQIRVDRVPEGISGYGFADDGEELMDDAEEFSAPPGKSMIRDDDSDEEEAAPSPAPANTQVAVDSDEEEEETVAAPVVQQPSVKKTPAAIAKRKAPTTTKGK
jgi:hypothetical protein